MEIKIETIIEAQPGSNSAESRNIVIALAATIKIKAKNAITDDTYINIFGLPRISDDRKNSSFFLNEYEETPL